jgi:hypothetical protein
VQFFACCATVGDIWVLRCEVCAPTVTRVVPLSPTVSVGGAPVVLSLPPWQLVHVTAGMMAVPVRDTLTAPPVLVTVMQPLSVPAAVGV